MLCATYVTWKTFQNRRSEISYSRPLTQCLTLGRPTALKSNWVCVKTSPTSHIVFTSNHYYTHRSFRNLLLIIHPVACQPGLRFVTVVDAALPATFVFLLV